MEKEKIYQTIVKQTRSLGETDPWYVPLFSNVSALLYEALEDVNWAGFYLVRGQDLVLGPFQGKLACIHIKNGEGVCGTALERDETMLVKDVHQFPDHIACDSASNSEIVVPIHVCNAGKSQRKVAAVLDIDSPALNRFDEEDRRGLEELVGVLEEMVAF